MAAFVKDSASLFPNLNLQSPAYQVTNLQNSLWEPPEYPESENFGLNFYLTPAKCVTREFQSQALGKSPESVDPQLFSFDSNLNVELLKKNFDEKVKLAPPLASIYQKNVPHFQIDSRPAVSSLDSNQLKYLTVTINDLTSSAEIIEPIIVSCFLYDIDLNKRVSETWRFVPKSLQNLPNCKELISRNILSAPDSVSFPFTQTFGHSRILFIASLDRLLVKDGGSSLEKYINKPSNSTKKTALEDIKKCNQKDTSQTFAWCHQSFAELIPQSDSGNKLFTNFVPCTTLDNEFLGKEFTNGVSKSKDKALPFTLSLNVYAQDKGSLKLQHFYRFAHSQPYRTFENKLFLNLKSARFKKPRNHRMIRNAVIVIKILSDGKELPLFNGSEKYVSRVHYHEDHPNFHDEVIINLQLEMPPEPILEFSIYHASVKPGAATSLELCGKATYPLFKDGTVIADGDHTTYINYGPDNPFDQIDSNAICFSTELFSSYYSSNPNINKILNGNYDIQTPQLQDLHPYIFAVLDSILQAIEKETPNAFQCLMEILSLYPDERNHASNANLIFYVTFCALRWPSQNFYKHLASQWLEHTKASKDKVRPDIVASWFLFDLIIKSLSITTSKLDLTDIIKLCTELTNSMSAYREKYVKAGTNLNIYMSLFFKDIIEVSSRPIGFQLLQKHLSVLNLEKHLFDRACFRDVLINILTPKIFLLSLVNINEKETFLDKYIVGGIAQALQNDQHTNMVFHTLFDLLSQFNEKQHKFIFKKLFSILSAICNNVNVLKGYSSGVNRVYVFAFVQYVLMYVIQDGKIEHKPEWCKMIAFMLLNAKHFKDSQRDTLIREFEKSDNTIEDLTKKVLGGINELSSTGSTASKPGARRFTSIKQTRTTDKVKRPQEQKEILNIYDALTFGVQSIAISFLDKYDSIDIVNDISVNLFNIDINPYLQEDVSIAIINFIQKDRCKFLLEDPRSNVKHVITKIIRTPTASNIKILCEISQMEEKYLKSTRRTDILLSRAFGKNPPTEEHLKLMQNTKFKDFTEKLFNINKDLTQDLKTKNPDTYAFLLYQKAEHLKASPDIQIEILLQLHAHQLSVSYNSEAVMAQLTAAAIVAEYMYHFKKIPEEFFRSNHPAAKFANPCPVAIKYCVDDNEINSLPVLRGYCTSKYFTEFGLIYLIQTAMETCKQVSLFELSTRIHSLLSPIAQFRSLWRVLQNHYSTGQISWRIAANMSTSNDRNLGAYYKVEYPDHEIFIYRETNLTNLWAVCSKLQKASAYYAKGKEVVTITEGTELNTEKNNDPTKYFIHVKHLTQYFTPEERQKRMTAFEQNHNVSRFYFDVPFSKNSQSGLEHCSLKRTIITLQDPLPFLVARVKPKSIETIIFSPIEYAVQNMQGQVSKIKEAANRVKSELKDLAAKEALHKKKINIDQNTIPSFKELQPLIQGSLLVQVNEGPEKMAAIFLNTQSTDPTIAVHQEKLRQIFREFLEANDEAVQIHGEMVVKLPIYSVLQEELVLGLSKLTSNLQQYLK
ncbi:memory T cell proliferation [Trichomonas vaginalis G3]|uniref:memory T cell proliferation n=1 Tax=Trichomonas vaginalis (strain ATCC PRA-98 / G3) TaxID=412133 RepID=UPI0021E5683D|nr:memory T cell proliferation [Trichomonas vaginalis G3]KAI5501669.1 memory T cell proliferation [Trichomonas vaginalis G3]